MGVIVHYMRAKPGRLATVRLKNRLQLQPLYKRGRSLLKRNVIRRKDRQLTLFLKFQA